MEIITYYILSAIIILILFYYYLTWNYDYWQKKGIPYIKGAIPGTGNILSFMLFQKNMSGLCKQFYDSMPQYSMVGFYHQRRPTLLIRDPEIVKNILVTNFASFSKNDLDVKEDQEPMLSKNPFFTSGLAWKIGRTRLNNAFTSGKLKILSTIIHEICCRLTEYTDIQISKNGGVFETELKSFFSRLTGEIVANAGFGIEGNCLENDAVPQTFREVAFSAFGNSFLNQFRVLGLLHYPWLLRILGIGFFPHKFESFFKKVVKSTIDSKKRERHVGMNFLQMTLDQEMKEFNDPEKLTESIVAHMISFFLNTFETTSITLGFLFHQIACHTDVQDKLRQEINSILAKNNKILTLEALNEMTYMDQVIYESIRLNSALMLFAKVCTQKVQLIGSDGLSCWVEPDTVVYVSVDGFHKDLKYWPEPEKFDPDRFDAHHVNTRHKFVFLPFSEGPRVCPGKRMAKMVLKTALSIFLVKYSFELSSKIRMPLKYKSTALFTYAKGGLWTKIKSLNHEK